MRWKKSVAVIPVALLLGVAACGGGSGGSGGSPGQPSQNITGGAAGSGQTQRGRPGSPSPGAKTGGTITVVTNGAPSTFDPTRAYYTDSSAIHVGPGHQVADPVEVRPEDQRDDPRPRHRHGPGYPQHEQHAWKFTISPASSTRTARTVTVQDVAYAHERSFDRRPSRTEPTTTRVLQGRRQVQGTLQGRDNYKGIKVSGNTSR